MLKKLPLIIVQLLYNVVLVSAIQCESGIGIYILLLEPPSHPHPQLIFKKIFMCKQIRFIF